ncbi:Integrin alpha-PS1 [Lamellibrachia satsuma]|nr:Integrin alpha-PS1 [Lamellibrachia satsuma]
MLAAKWNQNHKLPVNLVPRSFLKTRESAPLALTLTKIRAMAPQTPDWLITFLSKQEEREYNSKQLEQEREHIRGERHELLMRLLCETLDRRVRNNSPPHERSNGANDESNESQTQRTETNTTVDVCRNDESARNDEAACANNDPGHTKIDKVARKRGNVVKLEIPPHQNTTTDVVIVANRFIKRVMNQVTGRRSRYLKGNYTNLRQDLVVGAPFYLAPRVGGAFYVFMNGPEGITSGTKNVTITSRPMTIAECAELDCTSARFGFSLANIGDLDQDGYEDLAVGAPYEGNGAVYIFHGSQDGIVPEFAQRIVASDLPLARPLMTFGYSLSGGLDMDENGYPDIVVGAFESSKTVVLRSRPVINVQTMTQFTPDLIDPSVKTCVHDGRDNNCFKVRLCFKFTAKPLDRFTSKLDLTYILEAEKFTGKRLSRVIIKGADRQKSHKIERTITLNEQSNSLPRCKDHLIYIIKNNKDFLHPIQFQLTYKLKEVAPPTMSPGDSLPDMNAYPVLNDAAAVIKRSVDFKKNCGDNDICESDLHIRGILPLQQDTSGDYILKLGQMKELKLEVSVKNRGEDAHEATLYVDLPESLSYTGVTTTQKKKKYACIPTKSNVTCSVANPMSSNQRATFVIRLDASNIIASKHKLVIGLQVNTTSTELDERNDFDQLVIKVVVETDLLVRGSAAEPVEVFYGGEVKGESAITYEDEIGSTVIHSYEVKNKGPGRVMNVTVFISWPYEVESGYSKGKHLLYLMQDPEIAGNRGAFAGKCKMERGMVNPLRIKTVPKPIKRPSGDNTNYTVVGSPLTTKKKNGRSKREAIIPAEEFIDSSGRSMRVVIMDCDRKTAKCFTFPCVLGEIRKGESIVISMRSRLWNSTFVEDYTHVDHVRIFSKAEIKIDPSLSVKQTDTKNDISKAMTKAIPDIEVAEREGVPLWIIILAIIGGLLLLILLILLMWKCGFFQRKKADEMRKYRGKLEKKKYYDDDFN